jgi:YggT family protein
MNNPYVVDAADFLISVLFGIYITTVMLRFLFQLVRADFYNPISQALVTITNPPLRPLRRIIPGFKGIDVPSVVLLLALQVTAIWLRRLIHQASWTTGGLVVAALGDLLYLTVNVFLVAIVVQVIISWVAPGAYNPVTQLLYSLTRPVLRPARNFLPPVGGLDFSPMLVIVALVLLMKLLIAPIRDIGYGLM